MLETKLIKGKWCIVCGKSVLGKFRSEIAADKALRKDRAYYDNWSVGNVKCEVC